MSMRSLFPLPEPNIVHEPETYSPRTLCVCPDFCGPTVTVVASSLSTAFELQSVDYVSFVMFVYEYTKFKSHSPESNMLVLNRLITPGTAGSILPKCAYYKILTDEELLPVFWRLLGPRNALQLQEVFIHFARDIFKLKSLGSLTDSNTITILRGFVAAIETIYRLLAKNELNLKER